MAARTFLDTLFVIALINQRDQYHQRAAELAVRYEGEEFLTTDAVLLEIGNALAKKYRQEAVEVITHLLTSRDVEVVRLTPALFDESFALYRSHQDKEWGLIDCISFIVMRQNNIQDALTLDQHFVQAGFRALMRVAD
jgi:predicted nucleic acid-binding protein